MTSPRWSGCSTPASEARHEGDHARQPGVRAGMARKKRPEAVYGTRTAVCTCRSRWATRRRAAFPGCVSTTRPSSSTPAITSRTWRATFRGHPAVECWEPHNEPMFEPGRYNDNVYCYCPATVAAFRGYLRTKYGDVEALNANWRRNYGDFDEVQPPRRRGMYNDWLDWRLFSLDIAARLAALAHRHHPRERPGPLRDDPHARRRRHHPQPGQGGH